MQLCDAIAYLNADIDDAVRAGLVTLDDLPSSVIRRLGRTHSERIGAMVSGVVSHSWGVAEGKPGATVSMAPELLEITDDVRRFMFERVYRHPDVEREAAHARSVVAYLYEYFDSRPDELRSRLEADESASEWNLCDFVSGMTDGYASALYARLHTPQNEPRRMDARPYTSQGEQ
ncbi:MAG: hypothetical protein WKH64_04170 [Chloroflexia bacterium]